jgi:DNA repair exonuclease SbcCD ATPase subunit
MLHQSNLLDDDMGQEDHQPTIADIASEAEHTRQIFDKQTPQPHESEAALRQIHGAINDLHKIRIPAMDTAIEKMKLSWRFGDSASNEADIRGLFQGLQANVDALTKIQQHLNGIAVQDSRKKDMLLDGATRALQRYNNLGNTLQQIQEQAQGRAQSQIPTELWAASQANQKQLAEAQAHSSQLEQQVHQQQDLINQLQSRIAEGCAAFDQGVATIEELNQRGMQLQARFDAQVAQSQQDYDEEAQQLVAANDEVRRLQQQARIAGE